MDVAVLGASGDCGRQIAAQIVAARLLAPTERLQLVGRADGPSARVLHGLVSDLSDAHAEHVPDLDVALRPEDVVADIWVVSCGRTAPTDGRVLDRASLATYNAAIFGEYADALARRGQGTEVVIVVSNPVELGVALFARAIGKSRVIGIGAYQDTLRFRREIAADLGVRRQRVSGYMLGEHGDGQIPAWSSVRVYGHSDAERAEAIAGLRKGTEERDFIQFCQSERVHLAEMMAAGRVADALAYVDSLPPDVRVVTKPFVTHLSGAKTINATANVTVDLLQTLIGGSDVLIAGQAVLEKGEFYDLSGPFGVPLIASDTGIMQIVPIPLSNGELAACRRVSGDLSAKVAQWMKNV